MARAIFTYGRFNPPTMGHDVLIDKLKSIAKGDRVFVFTSQSNDPKRNPLDYKKKTSYMKKAFRGVTVIDSPKIRNMFDAITMLGKNYDEIVMVVGGDRVESIKRSAVKSAKKMGINMSVQSAGARDPDAEGSKGMSASKMRAAAARDDYSAFMVGCPASLGKKDCLNLFRDIKAAMGVNESNQENWFDYDEFAMFCESYLTEPQILDRLVQQLKDRGVEKNRAFAIATSQLQKAGVLKKGTQDLTKKGEKRQEMGAAGRAKDRAAKKDNNKPSDYKYNSRTNIATLKDSTMNEDKKPLMRWMDSFEKQLKKLGGSYKTVDPVEALKLYYKGVDPKKAAAQLKETVEVDIRSGLPVSEAKKDPRLSIVSRKISKLKDKERDLLASAINMSGGSAGAPMANRANLDRFNDGVIIPAMTFLRKNMSSLTPEGKKLGKTILKVLGEAVELDENIVSDKLYRASHGKKPNPNETGGWYFGFSTHSDDIVYQSPNKMKYKDAKKEAEKVAKEKGHKKIYVMASYDPTLDESRSDFDVDASPMIRKYIEQGKGIVASANSTLGGNSKFVVMKRPTSMGRAGQDQFMMATISDPSKGRIKMFAYHGTHPSKDGAMKMGKSRKLAESVELDEMKLTPKKMAFSLGQKAHMSGKRREPIKDNRLKALLKTVDDSKTRNAMNKEWLRGWDQQNLKDDVQFNESISFEFPSDEAAEKFMKEISQGGLGTSRHSGDGKVSTTTNSGRTDTPTMAHRDIARLMKRHGGKFVRSNEGPRVSKVFEAFADRKVVSTPSLGSLNAPSSNFRMNLPPTGKMKKQMQQIMKKDASYRRKMSNLVQKSETQKDGTITLHFSSARKRTSFQKLLHQGIKEGLCEERDYKKEYQNYHSKPEQRANRSKRVLARREMIKSGRASKGDGKDVDHKDGNPQNNSPSNLRMMSVAKNRSRNNNKEEYGAGEEGTDKLVDKYRRETPGQ